MTTVHAATATQNVVDGLIRKGMRDARAAYQVKGKKKKTLMIIFLKHAQHKRTSFPLPLEPPKLSRWLFPLSKES